MIKRFTRALRALHEVKAPASLSTAVFARVGLAGSYMRVNSVIGDVYVAFRKDGVCAVRRAKDDAAFEAWHRREFGIVARRNANASDALLGRIRRHLAGARRSGIQFDLRGLTPFERAVLEKAREIPRGEVRPYSWVAREIGRPGAVRAVGSALARNPVPLLIPCHRVVRSDGTVGQYVFGTTLKRALLTAEGAHFRT